MRNGENMYEYIPKRENKTAMYASLFLFVGAFILMAFPALVEIAYKWIPQLLGMIMLALCIAILTRYIFRGFIYSVADNGNGSPDLSVTEIQGKKRITVCRISLSGIEQAVMLNAANRSQLQQLAEGRKKFNYMVDIAPSNQLWIFAEECGEKLLIKISPDDRLAAMLGASQNTEV